MADKIANFEDYKKRTGVEDTDIDIQIEDPYNFFNEQEREEYFKERQKEAMAEKKEPEPDNIEIDEKIKKEPVNEEKHRKPSHDYVEDDREEYEDEYDEESEEEKEPEEADEKQ